MKQIFALGLLTALMTGCMSNPLTRCPLDGDGNQNCTSMQEGYSAALGTPLPSIGNGALPTYAEGNSVAPQYSAFDGYSQPRQVGAPVYQQAQVHRAWTAPWTDADGVMHGGEYVFFTTPGRWTYGSLKASGGASDIFRPASRQAFNVDPVTGAEGRAMEAAAKEAERAKVEAAKAKAKADQAAQQAKAAPALNTAVQNAAGTVAPTGITQPYQRLD